MRTSDEQRKRLRAVAEAQVAADQVLDQTLHPQDVLDLLADIAEVTRERDEARAAVRYLAQTLCDNGHPCVFDSVGGWVEIAYTTTGATVPDAQE